LSLAAAMTRAPKTLLRSHTVPTWALNDASRLRVRNDFHKLAPNKGGLLRVDETAIHLNVSEKTIRRLIKARALSAIRIGRLVRIQRREIERFLASACSSANKPQNLTEENGHE
jgi:excisionase family DNA binding protein